ncbi:hypothetical protein RRG08_003558 [Elysia crispata]|uniref:Uncharacterized protein n=1 Tax=Elysia crispata TaxID=231223 RepID=A0AAE1CTB8_9GAST|nr:hypothetical protein RRG08_003558 [Elysia crispata]
MYLQSKNCVNISGEAVPLAFSPLSGVTEPPSGLAGLVNQGSPRLLRASVCGVPVQAQDMTQTSATRLPDAMTGPSR